MTTQVLFGRSYRIVVSTIEVRADLDCEFVVERSLKPEPNKCEIKIWNLNPTQIATLEQAQEAIPVQVEAGYGESPSVLFLGDLRSVHTERDGPDLITTLASGDGEKKLRTARVNVSVSKGSKSGDVLWAVAQALGVTEGNLNAAVSTLQAQVGNLFPEGTVVSGSAYREMNAITRSLGLIWSVQNGALQILERTASLKGQAIKLSPETDWYTNPYLHQ